MGSSTAHSSTAALPPNGPVPSAPMVPRSTSTSATLVLRVMYPPDLPHSRLPVHMPLPQPMWPGQPSQLRMVCRNPRPLNKMRVVLSLRRRLQSRAPLRNLRPVHSRLWPPDLVEQYQRALMRHRLLFLRLGHRGPCRSPRQPTVPSRCRVPLVSMVLHRRRMVLVHN